MNLMTPFIAIAICGILVYFAISFGEFSEIIGIGNVELHYTGNTSNIEFLGTTFPGISQTLVRFDNGDTLLFKGIESNIPLHKKVQLHYRYNKYTDKITLLYFEIVRGDK